MDDKQSQTKNNRRGFLFFIKECNKNNIFSKIVYLQTNLTYYRIFQLKWGGPEASIL